MELWVKCQHGSLARHGVSPEGTKKGTYVPAHQLVWCPGPTLFEVDWVAAYRAGERMGGHGVASVAIVEAALGVEREKS